MLYLLIFEEIIRFEEKADSKSMLDVVGFLYLNFITVKTRFKKN